MRTKAEKNHKKPGEQKLNINLPSPKVVLNANDCARLLDGMGKTSVLLVEKAGKMVAATSKTSQTSSTSSLISHPQSSSVTSSLSSTGAVGAVTHTKICKNSLSSNPAKSNSPSESSEANTSCTGNGIIARTGHEVKDAPQQSKVIPKPPKKRRGLDKKFEEMNPGRLVLNNGDFSHPVTSPIKQPVDSNFMQRETGIHAASHLDSSQKHSVESLLQHSARPVVSNNNKPLISGSYSHDPCNSRTHPLPQSEVCSSLTSTTLPSTLLSNSMDDFQGNKSFHLPLLQTSAQQPSQSSPQINLTNQTSQQHPYTSQAASLDLSSQSLLTSKTKSVSDPVSFQQLPEQVEPMNLSTSCKPAVGLVSSQAPVATEVSKTAEDVSLVFASQHNVVTSVKELGKSEIRLKAASVKLAEVKKHKKKQPKPQSATVPQNEKTSDAIILRQINEVVVGNNDQFSEINHVPKSLNLVLNTGTHESTLLNEGTELPNELGDADIPASEVLYQSVEITTGTCKSSPTADPVLESDTPKLHSVSSPQSAMNLPILSVSSSPPNKISAPGHQRTDQLSTVPEINQKTVGETGSSVKAMKASKKRVEVPMDEVSCAQRTARYLVTIENVIANFVYIPEPVEEFSLTEEEEAAIRDQFEDTYDMCTSGSSNVKGGRTDVSANIVLSNKIITSETSVGVEQINLTVDKKTFVPAKPPKKRQAAALLPELDGLVELQDAQKTSENIDNVLTLVAAGVSNTLDSTDSEISSDKKPKKSLKKVAKQSGDSENKDSTADGIKKKRGKVLKKVAVSLQEGAGIFPCTLSEPQSSLKTEKINVPSDSSGQQSAETEKPSKAKKLNKRKAEAEKASSTTQISDSLDKSPLPPTQDGNMAKKKKKISNKPKVISKKKVDCQQSGSSIDTVPSQPVLASDKEIGSANRAETSDIGESIASTSGGSEQDTPVHELESKDESSVTDPHTGDRENHDTGLESASEDNKPVRRYKRRLDFVKCDQCEHQARGRSALSRHMKKVHMMDVNMPYKCQHCDYGCTKMASLNRHLFTHGVFPCSRCNFVTDERAKLCQHVMDEHKDKLDMKLCKVCNRYIKCEGITIEQHTEECQGPTPFKCSQCHKEFKYASSLRVHYHTHFPDQPKRFKCEQCDYRTNYKANLHKHHKNMHAERDRDVQCPDCGKLFSTEDNMRRHRKVHTLVRPFACETCKKTFKTSGALKGHQLIHTATRPFSCNIPGCNRSFRTAKFLKSHQEEFHRLVPKKFFCSIEGCNYSFFKRSHLKRHAITHTGERNFHCTWPGCSKSFRHADNLKVHFRSHTNEKPVQCHLCDFKCKQKNSLFWHKKKVHQIIDISVCSKRMEQKLKRVEEGDRNEKVEALDLERNDTEEKSVEEHAASSHNSVPETAEDMRAEDSVTAKSSHESKSTGALSDMKVGAVATAGPKESSTATQTPFVVEDQGPLDLYEFKSDEESEEETPGNFRRDKITNQTLTPLPPPPKELLRKNEIQELKEKERKEKAEKREQERKEKLEKKEQEKKEKAEKREQEKKEKLEKKEQEKREKAEKKEQEKKEKAERKEQEKREKLQKRLALKKSVGKKPVKVAGVENASRSKKKCGEKDSGRKSKCDGQASPVKSKCQQQESLNKVYRGEENSTQTNDQVVADFCSKSKCEKEVTSSSSSSSSSSKKCEEKGSVTKCEETAHVKYEEKEAASKNETEGPGKVRSESKDNRCKSQPESTPTQNSLPALKRKKSSSQMTTNSIAGPAEKKTKRGRKKKCAVNPDELSKHEEEPVVTAETREEDGSPLSKKKKISVKRGKTSAEESTVSVASSRASSLRPSPAKRETCPGGAKGKKKSKIVPPKRKPSARIKARKKAKSADVKSGVKSQKSPKPVPKRKAVRKKNGAKVKDAEDNSEETLEQLEETIQPTIDTIDKGEAAENKTAEDKQADEKCKVEEMSLLPPRPLSPAYSEEIMLQGKASPYRDFSDAENLEEENQEMKDKASPERPNSSTLKDHWSLHDEEGVDQSRESIESEHYEKSEDSSLSSKHALPPAEESSDDEVSNDIPLTPPRAPAPPPVESSEDEMEPELEPTPFSVPGPNTPFSVPGPNTPFSVPPPTNLMQQHSVHSEETPMSTVPSIPSMEMHSQGSVEMQQSLGSVEMHPHGSVEMNHSHGSVDMHHPQGSVEMAHPHGSVEMLSHNTSGDLHPHGSVDRRTHGPGELASHGSVEYRSQGSVELSQSHSSVEMQHSHGSISDSMSQSEQHMPSVRTPESNLRDSSGHSMSKYDLPQPLQDQSQASEADKEYFDQYLKSLSAANNRAANGGLDPSPSGLQGLEAMVGKTHHDIRELGNKSPISSLPTSVITSLDSTLPILPPGELRARMDALVSDKHHESLYSRDTASAISRLSDRQSATPLPPNMAAAPPFDAFPSLNSLHPGAASSRDNYLRQPDNLFPPTPVTSSFMAEAMFQRQAMTTPFLPPQASDRSSLSRIPDTTPLRSSSSSSLLRRTSAMPGSDMFSSPAMPQTMPRHPFANAWASQEVRPTHWQNPYLPRQPNMPTTGSFFPTKDNYLTGRDFMFDPSVRPSTERGMFPALSSSQTQDSFQLDRFDLSNYFPNAMTSYASSTGSLDYSRSAHSAASKPFDDRYRQSAASAATIPDFRSLPPTTASTDMFSGLPAVNPSFNLYAGNPMSYHTQHMTENVNSAFLTHPSSAQHAMFERDYAAAAAHRGLYPQNSPYPFIDERQYPGASKLSHTHPVAPTPTTQDRDLMSRSAAPESQMQDPYRSMLYRY